MRVSTRRILIPAIVVALCFAAFVQAQMGGQRGPQMSPEEAAAAWTLQATHVARALDLSKEQTTTLVDAYKAARESYQTAVREKMQEMRGGADEGDRQARFRGMREAQQEVAKAEIAKLEKALSGIGEEKTKKAVAQLGTFNGEWDRMVQVIAGFNLGDKQGKALDLTSTYNLDYTATRNEVMASGDREAMRGVREEHKTKLDDGLKAILSEEQMASWTQATQRRGRGGGGRQGGQ